MVPTSLIIGPGSGTRWLLCCASTELGTLGISFFFFFFFFLIIFIYIDMIPVHELDRSPFCQVLG